MLPAHTTRKQVRQSSYGSRKRAVRPSTRKISSRTTLSVKKIKRESSKSRVKKPLSNNQRHVREKKTNWNEIAKSNTLKKRMAERQRNAGTAKRRRGYTAQSVKKTHISRVQQAQSRRKVVVTDHAHTIKKRRHTAGQVRFSSRPGTAKKSSRPQSSSRKKSQGRSISHEKSRLAHSLRDLKIKTLLGEGAFSRVYLAKHRQSEGGIIALKATPSKKQIRSVISEGKVLQHLDHPFIVSFRGSFEEHGFIFIALDLAIGGEILHHFERSKHGRFDWERTGKFYVAELVSALSYLHSKKYVYRDLKPENVLLDREGHVKLVDFGFARKLRPNERCMTLCGSKEYVAPEVLTGRGYEFSCDIWSLGVLAYELTVGHLPYDTEQCNPAQLRAVICASKIRFPPFVGTLAKQFIRKLLVVEPLRRLTIEEVKKQPCFANIDWKALQRKQYKPPIRPKVRSSTDVSNYQSARFEEDAAPHSDSFKLLDSLIDANF